MSRTPHEPDQRERAQAGWELPRTAECSAGLRVCQGRGELKRDPYDYELENRAIYRYLCDACEQQLADDI